MRRVLPLLILAGCHCSSLRPDAGEGDGKDGDTLDTAEATDDRDGDSYTPADGDCDDDDASVHPGAAEDCNGVDDDCDGLVDGDDDDLVVQGYIDADGDGHAGTEVRECGEVDGAVDDATDCDDGDPAIHPDAEDVVCDGIDQDCDGKGTEESAIIGDTRYKKIQDALDRAKPGDVVEICPGVHTDRLTVHGTTDVTIQSWSGEANETVLDGEGARQLLDLTASSLLVRGLTLQNGANWGDGGCVNLTSSSLVLEQVTLTSCAATDNGGAIQVTEGSLRLDGVQIDGCHSGSRGGCIGLTANTSTEIVRSAILNAETSSEGAILHVRTGGGVPSTLKMDSVLVQDSAAHAGAGIHATVEDGSPLQIEAYGLTIDRSTTTSEGAVLEIADDDDASGTVTFTCSECTFTDSTGETAAVRFGHPLAQVDFDITFDSFSIGSAYSTYAYAALVVDKGLGSATVTLANGSIEDASTDAACENFETCGGAVDLHVDTSTWRNVQLYRNLGELSAVVNLNLDEGHTATFTDVEFGTGTDANIGRDLEDCTSADQLGLVTSARLDADAPCP